MNRHGRADGALIRRGTRLATRKLPPQPNKTEGVGAPSGSTGAH